MRLTIDSGGDLAPGKLTISANAPRSATTRAYWMAWSTARRQIALNVRFLGEALNAIKTPQIAIETTPQNPGVFKPVGADGYLHIVMPMTVR